MLLEDGGKLLCLCWAIHSSGRVAPAVRARSVPVTCAARDFHTNELRLSLWRARGSLIVFLLSKCTVLLRKRTLRRKAERWAHVEKLLAARRGGSRSRGGAGTQSVSFTRFPTHD